MHKDNLKLGYRPELDGIRGISILVVLFHHGYLFKYGRGGFLGVDIFFVLSGFLITSLLIEEWNKANTISLKKFYVRRVLRLYPALFVFLIVCMMKAMISLPSDAFLSYLKSIATVTFYMSNWIQVDPPLGPTWSLSIEEQFYILWPVSFFFMLKRNMTLNTISRILFSAIVLIVCYRSVYYYCYIDYYNVTGFNFRIYTGTDMRMDALLIGCLVGTCMHTDWIARVKLSKYMTQGLVVFIMLSLATMIVWIPIHSKYLYYGLFTLVALFTGIIIFIVVNSKVIWLNKMLQFEPMVWIGSLSYSIYIWHSLVFWTYDSYVPSVKFKSYSLTIFTPYLIKVAISIIVAVISYYLIEQPFLKLKRRFSV